MTDRIERFYSDLAKRIYDGIISVKRIPCIGDLHSDRSTHRNLYRFLCTEEGMRLLSLAATENNRLSEEHSDYENFVQILHLLPSLTGSGYFRYAVTVIETFCGENSDLSPENAEALWKSSLFEIKMIDFDILSRFQKVTVPDIADWICPDGNQLRNDMDFSEYLCAYERHIAQKDALYFDFTGIQFCIPDPYHSQLGFRARLLGEATAETDRWLSSQMLRVAGEICKKRDIPIIIGGAFDKEDTQALFYYLKKQERLPRVLLTIPMDSEESAMRMLLYAKESGVLENVSGLIPVETEHISFGTLRRTLLQIAQRYPMGKLVYLPKGKDVPETYIESVKFLRALSGVLAEQVYFGDCPNEETARSVGKRIFCENAACLFGYASSRMDSQ